MKSKASNENNGVVNYTKCSHCNDLIPPHTKIASSINGSVLVFCCTGCKAVAEWIHEEGLEQYYKVRTSAPSVGNVDLAKYQHYDLPTIYQKYVYSTATCKENEKQVSLLVEDIHCVACVWLIEKALMREEGVIQVLANASSLIVLITWDDSKIKLSNLLMHIAKLGYTPTMSLGDKFHEQLHQKRRIAMKRLIVSGLGMMQVMMYSAGLYAGVFYGMEHSSKMLLEYISFLVTTVVYFYSGRTFLMSAYSALAKGNMNMDLPVSLAITLAYFFSVYHFLTGKGDIYFDSVVMFIFFLLSSRYIEMMSRFKSILKSSQKSQMLPEFVILNNDNFDAVPLETIKKGDEIIVAAGEVFAIDGQLINGQTTVNESALTGEDLPVQKNILDKVYAGTINLEQKITVKVEALYQETVVSEIFRLLDREKTSKPKISLIIDNIAKYIVLFIILSSGLTYLFWDLLLHSDKAFEISLAVLVATCPCALSLAVPTVFAATSDRLSGLNLYVKNSQIYDLLAEISTIIFDKTGTLTKEQMQIDRVITYEVSEQQALSLASALEKHIYHPIAKAFLQYNDVNIVAEQVNIEAGKGVSGYIANDFYKLGNAAFFTEALINEQMQDAKKDKYRQANLFLSKNDKIIAEFSLLETESTYAKTALAELQNMGIKTVIASGDNELRVKECADSLNVDSYYSKQSPIDKLNLLSQLQNKLVKGKKSKIMMVGDGINDAPVLADADISIAVGEASALSRSQADIVMLNNDLRKVVQLINITKKAQKIMKQNIIWAILYNSIAIPIAVAGFLPPWVAAIGMSLSSLFVLLNALRIYMS